MNENKSRNKGYEDRFKRWGMKGAHRPQESEVEAYLEDDGLEESRERNQNFNEADRRSSGSSSTHFSGGSQGRNPSGPVEERRGALSENPRNSFHGQNNNRNFSGIPTPGEHQGKSPRNYQRRDELIYEDICEALRAHPEIDASELEIKVKNGIVQMTGSVQKRKMKWLAEEAIESVRGVKDINDQLTIRS